MFLTCNYALLVFEAHTRHGKDKVLKYLHRVCVTAISTKMDLCLLKKVEMILGYKFRNKKLLEEALTHPSFTKVVSYKRLEFIGNSILSATFTDCLFILYPFFKLGQHLHQEACSRYHYYYKMVILHRF